MIVLTEAFGNHSNRLFQSLHWEAYCHENGLEFFNGAFQDMAIYYPQIASERPTGRAQLKLCLCKLGLAKAGSYRAPEELMNVRHSGIVLVKGWEFRVPSLTQKYQMHFSNRFRINVEAQEGNPTLSWIRNQKSSESTVVGVHVRRGDYKEWQGGRYFFDEVTYEGVLERVRILLARNGKKARFVIFSAEPFSVAKRFEAINSQNPWHVDHFLMSQCDLLVGPPSTFTLWASYIGGIPYFHVEDPLKELKLDDFQRCFG